MPESVYCLGCGAAFPIDADPYPLNGGMCAPCIAEQRQRPWQIIAENDRLRAALNRIVAEDVPAWIAQIAYDALRAERQRNAR